MSCHRSKTRGTPYLSATARAVAWSRWHTATTSAPLAWNAGICARPKPRPMMPTVGMRLAIVRSVSCLNVIAAREGRGCYRTTLPFRRRLG